MWGGSSPAAHAAPRVGNRVRVTGLQGRVNDQKGSVVAQLDDGRYNVLLDGRVRGLPFSGDNLVPVTQPRRGARPGRGLDLRDADADAAPAAAAAAAKALRNLGVSNRKALLNRGVSDEVINRLDPSSWPSLLSVYEKLERVVELLREDYGGLTSTTQLPQGFSLAPHSDNYINLKSRLKAKMRNQLDVDDEEIYFLEVPELLVKLEELKHTLEQRIADVSADPQTAKSKPKRSFFSKLLGRKVE